MEENVRKTSRNANNTAKNNANGAKSGAISGAKETKISAKNRTSVGFDDFDATATYRVDDFSMDDDNINDNKPSDNKPSGNISKRNAANENAANYTELNENASGAKQQEYEKYKQDSSLDDETSTKTPVGSDEKVILGINIAGLVVCAIFAFIFLVLVM